jgi:hypothetical protein
MGCGLTIAGAQQKFIQSCRHTCTHIAKIFVSDTQKSSLKERVAGEPEREAALYTF